MSSIKTWKATSSQCVSVIPRLSVLNEFNPLNLVVECGFFVLGSASRYWCFFHRCRFWNMVLFKAWRGFWIEYLLSGGWFLSFVFWELAEWRQDPNIFILSKFICFLACFSPVGPLGCHSRNPCPKEILGVIRWGRRNSQRTADWWWREESKVAL